MVVLAKALSGGLVPVGAVLMSDAVYDSVYASFKRAIVHTSTYSENSLAMRAGLATLDVLEARAARAREPRESGDDCARGSSSGSAGYSMFGEVRGLGLLSGIEFQAPRALSPEAALRGLRKRSTRPCSARCW